MQFDPLAVPLREELLRALTPQLHELTSRFRRKTLGKGFSLHESCRVWVLDLPSKVPDDLPLESFRRKVQMWHHQIWRRGKPTYYARSVVPDSPLPGQPPLRLIRVTRSPRAAQLDAILAWLDQPEIAAGIGEPPGHDWRARLLISARFNLHALVLVDEEETIRNAVEFPNGSGDATLRVLDPDALRAEIARRPVCFGLQADWKEPAVSATPATV